MKKIAMIGMGKLGFPVALAWATKHDVVGYDTSSSAKEILNARKYPHREEGAQELLEKTTLKVVDSVADAVAHADIVFVAVQTPHKPEFEGITRMPDHRADFDYTALKMAVGCVAETAMDQRKQILLVIISTVLPGTTERELRPMLKNNPFVSLAYSPMFIAMGTTVADALNPEMVLVGAEKRGHALEELRDFYAPLHNAELLPMSIESAELTKVAYNVFLGLKIVAANSVMEIAHKVPGANCDDVSNALSKATDRVVSSKYMKGGMGDGGNCHPRDQIALSWLAQELDLSYDLFASMIEAREKQTEWFAYLCFEEAGKAELPIIVLGKAYKKDTDLTGGSPAILLKNILTEFTVHAAQYDPHVDAHCEFRMPAVFFIGTDHDEFYKMSFPTGSVVIDPWGKMKDIDGCKVLRVGRG